MKLVEYLVPFVLAVVIGNLSLGIVFSSQTSLELKVFALTFFVVVALVVATYIELTEEVRRIDLEVKS